MYSNCIFCSTDLGGNEVLELFPVGNRIAFDAWKGRLWAVCPRCARWNLAPIEERWEPVEQAEKLFRDARLRIHSENVGLARMPDGTRLIRVGEALPGELVAWRYGRQLLQRRNRYILGVTGFAVAVIGWNVLPVFAAVGGGGGAAWAIMAGIQQKRQQKIVDRVDADSDGARDEIIVRRWHVEGMSLLPSADRTIELMIRDAHLKKPKGASSRVRSNSSDVVTVRGDAARKLLARAMVQVNRRGADHGLLENATRVLGEAGSAEDYLQGIAAQGAALGKRAGTRAGNVAGPDAPVAAPHALALEMALNEDSERRAMEGELAALEAAWREAEEIAAIADSLPGFIRIPRWMRG